MEHKLKLRDSGNGISFLWVFPKNDIADLDDVTKERVFRILY